MKNIKLYEEFILDEKINFKKIAAGASILAILGMNIACSDKKFDKKVDGITNIIYSSTDSAEVDKFLENIYKTDKELHDAIMKRLYGNDQADENDRNTYKSAMRNWRMWDRDSNKRRDKIQRDIDSLNSILKSRGIDPNKPLTNTDKEENKKLMQDALSPDEYKIFVKNMQEAGIHDYD